MDIKEKMHQLKRNSWYLKSVHNCDVILSSSMNKYGFDNLIGLHYNQKSDDAPCLIFKKDCYPWSWFPLKVAKIFGIPCIEKKLLTTALHEEIFLGDIIPYSYFKDVANIYANLQKIKNSINLDFEKELQNDIDAQIYRNEREIFLKKARIFFRQNEKATYGNLQEELLSLAETNKLFFRKEYDSYDKIREYYIEHGATGKNDFKKRPLDFWLVVREYLDGKILVGNQYVYIYFNAEEKDYAVEFAKTLIAQKSKIFKNRKAYKSESGYSKEEYEKAVDSVNEILKQNYKKSGIRYNVVLDKMLIAVYLEKVESAQSTQDSIKISQKKMYMICITVKEYLHNFSEFKQIIENPHKRTKWNFWCLERAYKKELFENQEEERSNS